MTFQDLTARPSMPSAVPGIFAHVFNIAVPALYAIVFMTPVLGMLATVEPAL